MLISTSLLLQGCTNLKKYEKNSNLSNESARSAINAAFVRELKKGVACNPDVLDALSASKAYITPEQLKENSHDFFSCPHFVASSFESIHRLSMNTNDQAFMIGLLSLTFSQSVQRHVREATSDLVIHYHALSEAQGASILKVITQQNYALKVNELYASIFVGAISETQKVSHPLSTLTEIYTQAYLMVEENRLLLANLQETTENKKKNFKNISEFKYYDRLSKILTLNNARFEKYKANLRQSLIESKAKEASSKNEVFL